MNSRDIGSRDAVGNGQQQAGAAVRMNENEFMAKSRQRRAHVVGDAGIAGQWLAPGALTEGVGIGYDDHVPVNIDLTAAPDARDGTLQRPNCQYGRKTDRDRDLGGGARIGQDQGDGVGSLPDHSAEEGDARQHQKRQRREGDERHHVGGPGHPLFDTAREGKRCQAWRNDFELCNAHRAAP